MPVFDGHAFGIHRALRAYLTAGLLVVAVYCYDGLFAYSSHYYGSFGRCALLDVECVVSPLFWLLCFLL